MSPSTSNEAVRQATGREWDYWFALLSRAEAEEAEGTPAFGRPPDADAERPPELDHPALVRLLAREHPELSGWWQQMIVVEYEKEMGRRTTGETADAGFQLGVQKTIATSPESVWEALADPHGLAAWLGDQDPVDLTLQEGATFGDPDAATDPHAPADEPSGEVRVMVPGERVRLTWQPGDWPRASTLQVRVDGKPNGKTRVSVHHEHLPHEDARDAMRDRWQEALNALAERLES